jgi:hypothetical protein
MDWNGMELQLSEGYRALRTRAKMLLQETSLADDLHLQQGSATILEALTNGRISSVVSVVPPHSARITARAMEDQPERALGILMADLVVSVRWWRSQAPQAASNNSFVRQAISKRIHIFNAVLPDNLQKVTQTALMHLEHEELGGTYVNRETMHRLPVADIPRESFWVTEDGYAWKMDELASALITNGGEMRNPINLRMFSARDVQAINTHPMTKGLSMPQPDVRSPLQSSGAGTRAETLDKLDELATILVSDISAEQHPSRKALEDFLAYLLRLPESELQAIDELPLPGTELALTELVRAAQARKISLFRTGDLIEKAAESLR